VNESKTQDSCTFEKMKPIKLHRKYFWPLLIIVQVIVVKILALFPELVERFYSEGFYTYISAFFRIITGWTSISIGDIVYLGLLFFTLGWIWKTRKNWKSEFKNQLLQVLSFFSILSLVFHFSWGLNYQRLPLAEKLGIGHEYTLGELELFTEQWIERTNIQHIKITGDSLKKVESPHDETEMFRIAISSYEHMANSYPFLKYDYPSLKNSLLRVPLSYMGFGGYLNPFSHEAQINGMLPRYNLPTTTLHEISHQIGFAAESEANFIGVWVSIQSPDDYFVYSGYTYALKYLMQSLERYKSTQLEKLWSQVNPGILENYRESKDFWEEHENPAEPLFKLFYDRFLRLNQQIDGIEGYNRFIDLLINYEEVYGVTSMM